MESSEEVGGSVFWCWDILSDRTCKVKSNVEYVAMMIGVNL